jgi:autoinducer 2-degrading protein
MYVTLVHVHVKEEHIDDFKTARSANHHASVKEPGNRRFDILQSKDDPAYFVLYEAYEDEAGALAHKETGHYKKWRAAVESWMAEPRKGVKFDGLLPA